MAKKLLVELINSTIRVCRPRIAVTPKKSWHRMFNRFEKQFKERIVSIQTAKYDIGMLR